MKKMLSALSRDKIPEFIENNQMVVIKKRDKITTLTNTIFSVVVLRLKRIENIKSVLSEFTEWI